MLFKDISYLELWQPLCSVDSISAILVECIMRNNSVFGPVVQEEMLFKGFSYLELWQPFCSAERNHLCNFGKGYYEEQFCESIWVSGQSFKRVLIWSSCGPPVR